MKPLPRKSESLVTALTLSLLFVSAAAILFFYASPPATDDDTINDLLRAVVPRFFIAVFLLVVAIEYFPQSLASGRVSKSNLLWCLLPLWVTLVNFPASALIRGTARVTRVELLWLFVFKCLLIGLSEEVLFRGIIFYSLSEYCKKRVNTCFLPVLISSAVFALFHFINLIEGANILSVLQQVGYSFLIGAMLAVTLLKTKNIWLCVALHALFDFGGFLIADLGRGSPQDLTFWILTIVVGVGCAVQIVLTLIKMMKQKKLPS